MEAQELRSQEALAEERQLLARLEEGFRCGPDKRGLEEKKDKEQGGCKKLGRAAKAPESSGCGELFLFVCAFGARLDEKESDHFGGG